SHSDEGINAVYYAAGLLVEESTTDPSLIALVTELNHPSNRSKDRFCIWTDVPVPLIAARMRHELEHARQCRAHSVALWALTDLVGDVLAETVGESPGGAALYNASPVELDASAAAAWFVRRRYGDDIAMELLDSAHAEADGPNLRLHLGPGPLETLPARMLAFLWQFPAACTAFEHRTGTPVALALEAVWPGAEQIWSRLERLPAKP
ncbi:MAG: hypothetical protein ACR2OD_05910, partial [Gaiellaceae bacterium]